MLLLVANEYEDNYDITMREKILPLAIVEGIRTSSRASPQSEKIAFKRFFSMSYYVISGIMHSKCMDSQRPGASGAKGIKLKNDRLVSGLQVLEKVI